MARGSREGSVGHKSWAAEAHHHSAPCLNKSTTRYKGVQPCHLPWDAGKKDFGAERGLQLPCLLNPFCIQSWSFSVFKADVTREASDWKL